MPTPPLTWMGSPAIQKVVGVVLSITAIQLLVLVLKRLVRNRIQDPDVRYRLRKGIQFLGFAAMVLPIALIYKERLGGLTVTLGVAGAGIAFALQEIIASVAGWVAVSLGGFYQVGDRVQLGGIKGDVIDIGVLRTTLMELGQWVDGDLYNGRVVRVANSFVFKEPVFNYSGDFPFLWDEIKIPIKYGCDHHLALATLSKVVTDIVGPYASEAEQAWKELVRRYRVEHAQTAPIISLVANDNWMEFTLRYVVAYKARRSTKTNLFLAILDAVEASQGALQVASATFHLVEAPKLQVDLHPVGG